MQTNGNLLLGHHDMSNEEYHAHPAFSSSDIKLMAKSPRHFKHYVIDGHKAKESDAMEFGTLLHSAILENKFDAVKGPDVSRATKEWKTFEAAHADKVVLKPNDYHALNMMWQEAKSTEQVQGLLKGCVIEQSYFAVTRDNMHIKARPDALNINNGFIIDYKSAVAANHRSFTKAIFDRGYHLSMVHYIYVLSHVFKKPIDFFNPIWIAQEKTAPYPICIYTMSDELFEHAWTEYFSLINKIRTCTDAKTWPSYQEDVEEIKLPAWLGKHDQFLEESEG